MAISAFSFVTNLIAMGIELSLTTIGNSQLITLAVCMLNLLNFLVCKITARENSVKRVADSHKLFRKEIFL